MLGMRLVFMIPISVTSNFKLSALISIFLMATFFLLLESMAKKTSPAALNNKTQLRREKKKKTKNK
jgi:hypothetical protein